MFALIFVRTLRAFYAGFLDPDLPLRHPLGGVWQALVNHQKPWQRASPQEHTSHGRAFRHQLVAMSLLLRKAEREENPKRWDGKHCLASVLLKLSLRHGSHRDKKKTNAWILLWGLLLYRVKGERKEDLKWCLGKLVGKLLSLPGPTKHSDAALSSHVFMAMTGTKERRGKAFVFLHWLSFP